MKHALLLPILLLVACDALLVQPGTDFRVELHDPTVVNASQRLKPIAVRFTVHGCDSFEISVAERTTGGDNTLILDTSSRNDGTHTARIPISWFTRDMQSCGRSADEPYRTYPRLSALCLLDDRRVDSNSFEVSIVTAEKKAYTRGSVDHILSAQTPGGFLALGAGWMDWIDQGERLDGVPTNVETGIRPILARREDRGFLWIGCPLPHCENTSWEEGNAIVGTGGTHIFGYKFDPTGLDTIFGDDNLIAPGDVVDMVLGPEALTVLSLTSGSIIVTTYKDDTRTVRRLAETHSTTHIVTRDDGAQIFATLSLSDPETMLVHTLGEEEPEAFPLPATGEERRLSVSPDGLQFVFQVDGAVWLGDGDEWALLDANRLQDFTEVHWIETDLFLFPDGAMLVFNRSPPHDRNWSYLPSLNHGPGFPGSIRRFLTNGEVSALITETGVRILNTRGDEVGGADPMPCGVSPSAAAINGDTLAVGTTEGVLLFDLSRHRF